MDLARARLARLVFDAWALSADLADAYRMNGAIEDKAADFWLPSPSPASVPPSSPADVPADSSWKARSRRSGA